MPQQDFDNYLKFIYDSPDLNKILLRRDKYEDGYLPILTVAQEILFLDNKSMKPLLDNNIDYLQADLKEIGEYFDVLDKDDINYRKLLEKATNEYYRSSQR